MSVLGIGAVALLATQTINTRAEAQAAASSTRGTTTTGNPITGVGLPNPAPVVTRNWGQLPAGRKWGTTAGIDVDPIDGNIWAYERCGAATAGGGPVDCDNTLLDNDRVQDDLGRQLGIGCFAQHPQNSTGTMPSLIRRITLLECPSCDSLDLSH